MLFSKIQQAWSQLQNRRKIPVYNITLTTDSNNVLNISITGVSFCFAARAAFMVSIAAARSGVDEVEARDDLAGDA